MLGVVVLVSVRAEVGTWFRIGYRSGIRVRVEPAVGVRF